MCIFQSEQVIKLKNSWFYWKQRMATEFARSQTRIIMYHVSHVIIHKLQYATTWLVEHTGGEGGGEGGQTSHHGAEQGKKEK